MHRNRCNISDGVHVPDLLEQLLLGKYMIRITCKEGQEVKLLSGQNLFIAIDKHPSGSFIDLDSPDLNKLIFLYTTVASQPLIP